MPESYFNQEVFGGIESDEGCWSIILLGGDGRLLVEHSEHSRILPSDTKNCVTLIKSLVNNAKRLANLPPERMLASLGISLSVWDEDHSNDELHRQLMAEQPQMSRKCYVCGHATAAIAAASLDGSGVVLIAGTGSRSFLRNPDGSTVKSGGWGHKLTEVGSAAWLSRTAVKTVIDAEDNRRPAPHDTTWVKNAIFEYFGVKDRFGLLRHYYQEYDKHFHAGLCKKIVDGARDGDALCRWLMYQTGKVLGEYLAALCPSIDQELLDQPGGLKVLCVGQMWENFNLMEQGFSDGVLSHPGPRVSRHLIGGYSLFLLEVSTAVGAAYLASEQVIHSLLSRHVEGNTKRFYQWSRQQAAIM